MLSEVREKLKPWVEKSARPFVKAGLKPNYITVIALLTGLFAGILFAWDRPFCAGIVVLVGGYFDMIDGAVARAMGEVTEFGGVLDSVFDRVADAALYVGVLIGGVESIFGEPTYLLPVFALIGSLAVSYVRARAESAGTGELDVGIAERAERLIILTLGALSGFISYALLVITALTAITVVQRLYVSHQRLASGGVSE